MEKKLASGLMLTLLLMSMLTLAFNVQPVKAEPRTWTVDDDGGADFTRIQDAVYAASLGDTIYVYNGTYYEHIYVYKSLTLIGENKYAAIIDGSGWAEPVVTIRWTYRVNLTGFTIRNGGYGILVERSNSNTFFGNLISKVGVRGIAIEGSWGNIISGNTVSEITGNPVVPGVGGHIAIWLDSHHNIVVGNNVSKAEVGIYLETFLGPGGTAHDNTVSDNFVSDIEGVGINVWGYNNKINHNNVTNVAYCGVQLNSAWEYPGQCTSNIVNENIISNSVFGINLIMASVSNTIAGNNISNNGLSIFISDHSDNNTVINNLVSNNDYGILLFSSNNTKVYHNNFIENTQQVLLSDSFNTAWDDGYPSGGNYWGDYEQRYPDAQELDDSGIWGTPYEIDASNQDNYPLMYPYGIHAPIRNLNTRLVYLTIQSAIDTPKTLDGHTILVDAGRYYENVFLYKSLTLMGENPETTIIDGKGSGHVIEVTADQVMITGFTFQHGWGGISLLYSSGTTVTNNILTLNEWSGIEHYHSNNNTIRNNKVTFNNHAGIWLINSRNNAITSNTVSGNSWQGILLGDSSKYNAISNNKVSYNGYDGITLTFSDDNRVKENLLTSNLYAGIHLIHSGNSDIAKNTISSSQIGIVLHDSSNKNTISDNRVVDNEEGILLDASDKNKIDANEAVENGVGIRLWYSVNNTISYNTATSNAWAGIVLDNSSNGNRLEANTVTSNTWDGILISGSSHNMIEANIAKNNYHGIILVQSSNNKVERNRVMHNDYGIATEYFSEHNKIEQNKALTNEEFDLYWDLTGIGNIWEENRYRTKNW